MWQQGLSFRKIGRALDVDEGTIRKRIKLDVKGRTYPLAHPERRFLAEMAADRLNDYQAEPLPGSLKVNAL